ncbi:glycosyltransferase family 25 protein [Rufibacter sediminis]|uniref:Glycosyltransferase family 25 protein n=1 Tax=Rufibacter sediminis TaxID=2762756 RepID=A0ABR6VT46_9BACT|nr:glycosyltransferase family 25 protein [Rufibacter sediminis]MBC3540365.1 glycosyltransferase family 25 protein [Rufibacter sediminis]
MQQYLDLLNQRYDKIYVITLQRAHDRQAQIRKELAGLQYEFFYGQDKKEFTVAELTAAGIYDEALAKKHHRYNKPMPPGMIGCSWSHRLIYEDVVKHRYQQVLILEDDVVLDNRNLALLPEVFSELPSDWELFYFGFALHETPPANAPLKKLFYHLARTLGFFKFTHTAIRNLYPTQLSKHIYKAGYHDCTHAYALTYSAAEKLAELQTPISFFPDHLLAYASTNELVKAYLVLPKLINQQFQVLEEASASYIHG